MTGLLLHSQEFFSVQHEPLCWLEFLDRPGQGFSWDWRALPRIRESPQCGECPWSHLGSLQRLPSSRDFAHLDQRNCSLGRLGRIVNGLPPPPSD